LNPPDAVLAKLEQTGEIERVTACARIPSAAAILDFLRPRVAKFWLPDAVVFLEAVPKTSVGKFDKKVLRERFKDWQPLA
jgi:acyl-CoA synthetase (AMP-forming)/AMP-acid ligase II